MLLCTETVHDINIYQLGQLNAIPSLNIPTFIDRTPKHACLPACLLTCLPTNPELQLIHFVFFIRTVHNLLSKLSLSSFASGPQHTSTCAVLPLSLHSS